MESGELQESNPVVDFYEKYNEDFKELLGVPLLAMCKENHELVPYEYSSRQIRYRRRDQEVNECLATKARALAIYCVRNKINKSFLTLISGGNLYSYDQMKKSYGQ